MQAESVLLIKSAEDGAESLERVAQAVEQAGLSARVCGEPQRATDALREMISSGHEPAVVVIAPRVTRPLSVARQVYKISPLVQIIFLGDGERATRLRREMAIAPMIGTNWAIAQPDADQLARQLSEAARSTRQRRQLRTTLDRVNLQLSSRAAPDSLAYRKLVISDRYLASVLLNADDAIMAIDARGVITTWNRAAEQLFGWSEQEAIGRHIESIAGGEWTEALPRIISEMESGEQAIRREIDCRSASGESIAVEMTFARVLDEASRAMAVSIIARDITERKRIEEERAELLLKEKAAKAEADKAASRAAFLAEAGEILAASLDYETTLCNLARLIVPALGDWCIIDVIGEENQIQRLATAHALPEKEELMRELQRRYPPDWNSPQPASLVLRTGEPELLPEITDEVLANHTKDAEHFLLLKQIGVRSHMAIPLTVRGNKLGSISFGISESDRSYGEQELALAKELGRRAALAIENARLYREAQEANRLKDEFLAIVSHELRTPLNAILGWARMLRTGKLDEQMLDRAMETIERNARAQAQLIEDLLDVSRIISGKLRLEVRPVELVNVIEAAIDSVRPAAEAKGIRLEVVLDPLAGPVSGDMDRLQQVVWNLLSNAVKFTPKGGRIQARLERANSHVEITVSDTGIGIHPDFLPYVFDRFRQADSSHTRSHGGLGLGLSIVRHLVELHGGTVQVYSEGEGRGASFVVKLPLMILHNADRYLTDTPEQVTPALQLEAHLGCAPSLDGLRVLVVDDEPDARALLKTVLEQCNAKVSAVASAGEAIEAFQRIKPDVLVSDIEMPGEDGYSLIRKIRALEADLGWKVPAAALTAHARTQDRLKALSAGYQMHAAKPVEPVELIAIIASLANRIPNPQQQKERKP